MGVPALDPCEREKLIQAALPISDRALKLAFAGPEEISLACAAYCVESLIRQWAPHWSARFCCVEEELPVAAITKLARTRSNHVIHKNMED